MGQTPHAKMQEITAIDLRINVRPPSAPVAREIKRVVTRAARGMGFLRAGEQAYLLSKLTRTAA